LRFEHIKLESLGDVVRLSINRPERLNAIDWKTRSEIVSALKLVGANSRVRCVILTGVGRRAFSAGEDLGEVKELSPSKVRKWAREWTGFLVHIMTVPQPMVTSSPGYSVGAGWQLFLLGDYRIASETAAFSMPEVDVGLPSILGGAILMSIVGAGQVGRFTMMGETIYAKQALELGIVHKVVPPSELERATVEAARRLADKPPTAVRLQKDWNRTILIDNFRRIVAEAPLIYDRAFSSGEPQRGVGSFFKKRKSSGSRVQHSDA